ncbi:hypothetical protein MSAR_45970 [Mycolicibacterium sarraceniae]|uniref:Uncharacterized protein n=1 Tax=Mycolicibacterium sarraceniae TaxID=1534348 RepID=A0A7I7SYS2_9MYCO|nr:hypothetical protein MSAR_45970 [Mycolicibacterium sarraceniae]
MAAISPASTGASEAMAMPSDSGNATRNTTSEAGRSWRKNVDALCGFSEPVVGWVKGCKARLLSA